MKPFPYAILYAASVLAVFHAYFGYPLSILLLGLIRGRKAGKEASSDFSVTIVITAFNEARRIDAKMANTRLLDYPGDRLQVLVASDGSTDGTNDLVRKYREDGIELVELAERKGKENAQREALRRARGEIIVFTDVATMLERDAIRKIVSNFADPSIGCVSSEDRVLGKDGRPSGENLYVRYEMWLRRLESRVSSPVGLSGSFFAARRTVCGDLSAEVDSDLGTLLNTLKRGLRGTTDPEAIGYYRDLGDPRGEFERKVRTVLRGLTIFFRHVEFLNVFRYGVFSYQFFCHKLLRWMVPFLMVLVFLLNLPLATGSPVYFALLSLQILFYAAGLVSIFGNLYASSGLLLKVPAYFLTVNASIFVAWLRFLSGERIRTWTPSER